MTLKELHKSIPDWLLIAGTVLVAVFFLLSIAYLIIQSSYNGRVYPGVRVAGMELGGQEYANARQVIESRITEMQSGVPVRFGEREAIITPTTAAFDPDLSAPAVEFSVEATLAQATTIGRQGNALRNGIDQLRARFGAYNLPLRATIDPLQLKTQLTSAFADLEQAAVDARINVSSDGSFTVSEEKNGRTFDYETAVVVLSSRFENANRETVILKDMVAQPKLLRSDVKALDSSIKDLLALQPLTLEFEKSTWKIDAVVIAPWISVERRDAVAVATLSSTAIEEYLIKKVEPKTNIEPQEARLSIENGRVSVWQGGRDGRTLDRVAATKAILDWSEGGAAKATLTTLTVANTVTDQSAEELGLREIIGTGTSKFSGSPTNRRHNIRTGANALNGLLIKPGEEFSLLKALGSIDAKNGYLPELVIKGNKTIPEYGGGLCQIGTTVFRATFNSGLPVTQRRNHSYRVSYYEPAGTDATIYDPAPDYRFMNDTGHHILIQARFSGDSVYFDFWGTKDGRKVVATAPVIYNIVKPAPTKIIETPDLPEGKRKCTESAHAGADAYFDYTVTYPNGEVKSKRFSSHYVPWQAVCLVGAKKASPSTPPTPTGTATPSVTATVTPSTTAKPAN